MFAGHQQLSGLTCIVDRNRLQQGALTEETNSLDPLDAKFEAFGWDATVINGHDHDALREAILAAGAKPRVVIAETTKGKGVSFGAGGGDAPSQASARAPRRAGPMGWGWVWLGLPASGARKGDLAHRVVGSRALPSLKTLDLRFDATATYGQTSYQ